MTDTRRPRVLVLTHRVPFPPDKGDRIRTYHILKWLSARAVVDLACLADEPVDAPTLAGLTGLCERSVGGCTQRQWRLDIGHTQDREQIIFRRAVVG